MGFEWDPAKDRLNLQKHGIGFDYAIRIFEGPLVEYLDDRRDYGEVRIVALGGVDNRILTVIYTLRQGERRIISARVAKKHERKKYSAPLSTIAFSNRGH